MTATITAVTVATITAYTYDVFSTVFGAIAIGLLLILLVQKEILRAVGGTLSRDWTRTLNVAIVPLLVAFGVIIVLRLVSLIYP